jgi:hypothetical protein
LRERAAAGSSARAREVVCISLSSTDQVIPGQWAAACRGAAYVVGRQGRSTSNVCLWVWIRPAHRLGSEEVNCGALYSPGTGTSKAGAEPLAQATTQELAGRSRADANRPEVE